MRKFIFWVAIAGLLFVSCISKETQWVLIKDGPSLSLFIERSSIKQVSGDLVRVWVTFAFKEPKENNSKSIQKALSYDEIDCAKRTLQVIKVTFYFTDGTTQSLSEKLAVTGINPGSPGEFEYNYLCKKR
jgi:hypothetical protein